MPLIPRISQEIHYFVFTVSSRKVMKSEGTKEAVESSYYAKKLTGTGRTTGENSEVQSAVNY